MRLQQTKLNDLITSYQCHVKYRVTATYFKKYLLSILWDFDGEVAFSGLVGKVEVGTSDSHGELNVVVQWVFVAVKSTILQHTEPLDPLWSDIWWLNANVHETYNHSKIYSTLFTTR